MNLLFASILLLSPSPEHHWDATQPMLYRITGKQSHNAEKQIRKGMSGILETPRGCITVHMAGPGGNTLFALYPATSGSVFLILDDKHAVLGADLAISRRTRQKDIAGVVAQMLAVLRTPIAHAPRHLPLQYCIDSAACTGPALFTFLSHNTPALSVRWDGERYSVER